MDTDSFILSMKTTNLLKDLEFFKDGFDFSELDKSHELYNPIKKVIGEMKIETSPIFELDNIVALRSKSYADSFNLKENSKQKAIQKSLEKGSYNNSLFDSQTTTATNLFN